MERMASCPEARGVPREVEQVVDDLEHHAQMTPVAAEAAHTVVVDARQESRELAAAGEERT